MKNNSKESDNKNNCIFIELVSQNHFGKFADSSSIKIKLETFGINSAISAKYSPENVREKIVFSFNCFKKTRMENLQIRL